MIQILLKHTIYNYCIDMIFDRLKENFKPVYNNIPKVGDFYSRIVDKADGTSFYNCIVKRIKKRQLYNVIPDYLIHVRYETCNHIVSDDNNVFLTTTFDNNPNWVFCK